MFGTLNLADILKWSKEQAQAVLAEYAKAVQGQYAVVPKKKKGDQNRWSQDANSTEYRKWQSEQQKTTHRSNRSSASTFATKMVKGVAKAFGCLLYTSPSPRDLSTSRMPSSA